MTAYRMVVPDPVDLSGCPGTRIEKWTFRDFFVERVLGSLPNSNADEWRDLRHISDQICNTQPGGSIHLTEIQRFCLLSAMPKLPGELYLRALSFYECVATAEKTEE